MLDLAENVTKETFVTSVTPNVCIFKVAMDIGRAVLQVEQFKAALMRLVQNSGLYVWLGFVKFRETALF